MSTSFDFDVACGVCGTRGTVFWAEYGHADRNEKITEIWGPFREAAADNWLLSPAHWATWSAPFAAERRSTTLGKSLAACTARPTTRPSSSRSPAPTRRTSRYLAAVLVRVRHKGEVLIEYSIMSRQAAIEGHQRIGAALEAARGTTRPDQAVLDGPLEERVAGCPRQFSHG